MKTLLVFCAAFAISTSTAMAGSFSGNWPITVSGSQRSNGSYCLTVKDDGSVGWPHSGYVSLTGPSHLNLPFGTFQVIGRTFTVTVEQEGSEGQNAGLVFSARVRAGSIGDGVYDQVYGGEESDSGAAAFGAKGGC